MTDAEMIFESALQTVEERSRPKEITADRTMALLKNAGVIEQTYEQTQAQAALNETGGSIRDAASTLSYVMLTADKLDVRRRAAMDILSIHSALPRKEDRPTPPAIQVFVQNSPHVNLEHIVNPRDREI